MKSRNIFSEGSGGVLECCGLMSPKELAKQMSVPEEGLYLAFEGWTDRVKEYVSAFAALASKTLEAMPERTRKEHRFDISGPNWTCYSDWYNVRLHGQRANILLSLIAKSPFAFAWYGCSVERPVLLAKRVPNDQVALCMRLKPASEVLIEVVPYQKDHFLVTAGGEDVYTATAQGAALRTLNWIVGTLSPK